MHLANAQWAIIEPLIPKPRRRKDGGATMARAALTRSRVLSSWTSGGQPEDRAHARPRLPASVSPSRDSKSAGTSPARTSSGFRYPTGPHHRA